MGAADMNDPLSQEEIVNEARDELGRAIQKYQDTVTPGEYVTSWVVINERTSIELTQSNASRVGVLSGNQQSFVITRGLLDIALANERMPRVKP